MGKMSKGDKVELVAFIIGVACISYVILFAAPMAAYKERIEQQRKANIHTQSDR